VVFFIAGFLTVNYFFASAGSLVGVAAASGLFYFALRFTLALYIRLNDGVSMAHPAAIITATICYMLITMYVFIIT
jgi:hypothetical protein